MTPEVIGPPPTTTTAPIREQYVRHLVPSAIFRFPDPPISRPGADAARLPCVVKNTSPKILLFEMATPPSRNFGRRGIRRDEWPRAAPAPGPFPPRTVFGQPISQCGISISRAPATLGLAFFECLDGIIGVRNSLNFRILRF